MAEIDRDDLIDLLERLGSGDDAEVLAVAREVHRRIAEAGLTWDDLLVWDEDEEEDEEEEEDDWDQAADEEEIGDTEVGADTPRRTGAGPRPDPAATGDIESLPDDALIDRILGECDLSDETRRDLLDLKGDIARGDFTAMDRKYIRALYTRLRP